MGAVIFWWGEPGKLFPTDAGLCAGLNLGDAKKQGRFWNHSRALGVLWKYLGFRGHVPFILVTVKEVHCNSIAIDLVLLLILRKDRRIIHPSGTETETEKKKQTAMTKGIKSVKMDHKTVELQENCDPGRKPGEGNENWESHRKIRGVGTYALGCRLATQLICILPKISVHYCDDKLFMFLKVLLFFPWMSNSSFAESQWGCCRDIRNKALLTWCGMYFEEAQEKLKNKLLLLKNPPPLALVRAVDPHIPTLPPSLANKQLLYTAHSHQRLWNMNMLI